MARDGYADLFDDATSALVARVYVELLRSLQNASQPALLPAHESETSRVLCQRIVALAVQGIRDADELIIHALAGIQTPLLDAQFIAARRTFETKVAQYQLWLGRQNEFAHAAALHAMINLAAEELAVAKSHYLGLLKLRDGPTS